jgi:hypothetical protein
MVFPQNELSAEFGVGLESEIWKIHKPSSELPSTSQHPNVCLALLSTEQKLSNKPLQEGFE